MLNAEVVTPWRYHSTISQQSWQQSPHHLFILFYLFLIILYHIVERSDSKPNVNVTGATIFLDAYKILYRVSVCVCCVPFADDLKFEI